MGPGEGEEDELTGNNNAAKKAAKAEVWDLISDVVGRGDVSGLSLDHTSQRVGPASYFRSTWQLKWLRRIAPAGPSP